MCGLITVLNYAGQSIDRDELIRVRDAMKSRGPDGAGLRISSDRQVGMGHCRLSLLDLSDAGMQPMIDPKRSLWIVFNGEIYNHTELRHGFEAKGVHFKSHSDTEVLLHLYAERGARMVDDLRGMYAFVIWDEERRELFAARDPFGIKPLYYADDGHSIRFASQVKALLHSDGLDTSPDPAGQVGFLLWGYVPEPFTLYKRIAALPAGASMSVDVHGRRTMRQFCRISDEIARLEAKGAERRTDPGEFGGAVRSALADSVKYHLRADVPVGVFLSAGLDSAAVAGLAAERLHGKVCSVTLGFREHLGTINDETMYARLIADHYSMNHRTRWVARDEFEMDFAQIVEEMDQPSTDGINTYFVSKAASEVGLKTALSGLGGDELFGTYRSFRDVPHSVQALAGNPAVKVGRAIRRLAAPIVERVTSPKYAGLFEYGSTYPGAYMLRRGLFMPWEIESILAPEVAREGWERLAPLERLGEAIANIRSERLKLTALEMSWYMRNQLLRDSDWAGMAHSIEIRVPMVDLPVLRALVPRLAGEPLNGKRFLADVPARGLPEQVVNRAKTGFNVPMHEWTSWLSSSGYRRGLGRGLRAWALRLMREFHLNG